MFIGAFNAAARVGEIGVGVGARIEVGTGVEMIPGAGVGRGFGVSGVDWIVSWEYHTL